MVSWKCCLSIELHLTAKEISMRYIGSFDIIVMVELVIDIFLQMKKLSYRRMREWKQK